MPKPVMLQLFLGGAGAVCAGVLLGIASIAIGHAGSVFTTDAGGIVAARVSPVGFAMVGLATLSGLALMGGALAGVVAWAGALANALAASDRRWFALLVALGAPTFGVGAVVACLIAGPGRLTSSR